ncbi:MAG: MarR family transcriptional regulator [Nanoarchaeota archaeon]|nr:MarR family transcriptional regulator [Nanoarchaeota archaeon]
MHKLKFTILQLEILRFLCANAGRSFNARRIAQHLEVSQTAIAKSLPLLEKEKFILIEKDKESGRLAIELDKENKKVIEYKRAENLRVLYESGIVDFLSEEFANSAIIVYGDYANGEDIFSSDIEIAIVKSSKSNPNLSKYEKELGKKIELNSFSSFGKIDSSLKNKILNGIVLHGEVSL